MQARSTRYGPGYTEGVFGPEIHEVHAIMIVEDLVTGERFQWTFDALESSLTQHLDHDVPWDEWGPITRRNRTINLQFNFGACTDIRVTDAAGTRAWQAQPEGIEAAEIVDAEIVPADQPLEIEP